MKGKQVFEKPSCPKKIFFFDRPYNGKKKWMFAKCNYGITIISVAGIRPVEIV